MSKCKVCGYRLGDGVTKCPMCGAVAGSTVAGEISAEMDLPKYLCPSCKGEIFGEHRYCPHCGIDIKEAIRESETARKAKEAQLACKCPKCGAEVQMNSKFCSECGANLEELRKAEEASKAEEARLAQEAAQTQQTLNQGQVFQNDVANSN